MLEKAEMRDAPRLFAYNLFLLTTALPPTNRNKVAV